MAARVLTPGLNDPELALLNLSQDLLPAALVGVMLAGLFAATMSTADSQILSCSTALTQDLFPDLANSFKAAKIGTLIITAMILIIALVNNDSVFSLITFSWSVLASGLGVLLILRCFELSVSTPLAIAIMLAGVAGSLIWKIGLNLSDAVYEVFPGMATGLLVYLLSLQMKKLSKKL